MRYIPNTRRIRGRRNYAADERFIHSFYLSGKTGYIIKKKIKGLIEEAVSDWIVILFPPRPANTRTCYAETS